MDKRIIKPYIEKFFASSVLPNLMEFIKIPNCSPNYDPDWEKNGEAVKAANFLGQWVESLCLEKTTVAVLQDPGHTPFIYIDVKTTSDDNADSRTILLYGHLDKQPAFTGWSEGLGPQLPIIKDGKLYGRGSSDDGYAIFAAVSSIKTCQDNKWPLPRIVILIEGAEESHTDDLYYYYNILKTQIGNPNLVICLDSGCADYNRLWVSTSLRGVTSIDLKVSVLSMGIHSGLGGGIVPESFMITRQILDRIENPETGEFYEKSLFVDIPSDRNDQIDALIKIVGEEYIKNVPWYGNTGPLDKNIKDTIIRNTWKPTLTITGCEGIPDSDTAGNVLRPYTELKLSIRLPPLLNAEKAATTIKDILEMNPPYNAKVEATIINAGDGWNLGPLHERLGNILNIASNRFYNNDMAFFGEGGSVPFLKFFNDKFDKAEFAVLGVCGPTSNIHGPDENLDLDFVQKLIMSLTYLISEY